MNMIYGIPEERGLRCPYHGWCFDETGQCIEQPYEEAKRSERRFKDKIQTRAYPVREQAGLLMAYLGPEPAPLLPNWDVYAMPNVVRDIGYADAAVQLAAVPGELASTRSTWSGCTARSPITSWSDWIGPSGSSRRSTPRSASTSSNTASSSGAWWKAAARRTRRGRMDTRLCFRTCCARAALATARPALAA